MSHDILLEKLELYLENRKQYVMVESRLSDPLSVGPQGVPQGSLLSPLCFIIFYNDFPAVRGEGHSVM